MKRIAIIFALFAATVSAQTYEGSSGGWAQNPTAGDSFFRNYGVADAAGNYAYQHYSLYNAAGVRTSSYNAKPDFRAARIIIANGVSYAQFGDATCAAFSLGKQSPATCPPAADPPPPIVPVGPVTTRHIVVVPLRYLSPPSTSPDAVTAYNASLPKVTQPALQKLFDTIATWWNVETYGRNVLKVQVLPAQDLAGNRLCDYFAMMNDGRAVAQFNGATYDVLVVIAPYSCWQYHALTSGNVVVSNNTYQDSPGTMAHEVGHAVGLLHNAVRMPTYIVYGSGVDQMGSVAGNLLHFLADHKEKLQALTPLPCASATLRSIYTYPDAIRCGGYVLDYLSDWGQVWVHLREWAASSYGWSDTTDVAKLSAGQSYTGGGYTFTHEGNGKVTVKP